ncbi:hypothetical protein BX600DRAFT_469466 [Xylariales sp. PMI_506]|nr:hypothetical protein BX600DRAFT_469466 [Xylariales sp. PMI_506]
MEKTQMPSADAESDPPEPDLLWRRRQDINSSILHVGQIATKLLTMKGNMHFLQVVIDDQDPSVVNCLREMTEIIDEHLALVRNLKPKLEDRRNSVRDSINNKVRRRIRPLNILDLPDELLMQVFDYVRGHTSASDAYFSNIIRGDIDQIKKVRLTCRRFCTTSSHLLLQSVEVNLTRQSLGCLEEISRHPIIRKGILAIRVTLEFYGALLAEDIRNFARYHESRLDREMDQWEYFSRHSSPVSTKSPKDYSDALARADSIYDSWHDVAEDGVAEDDDSVGTIILRRAHEQYRQHYQDQKILREGLFTQITTEAMTRLPAMAWMDIEDGNRSRSMESYRKYVLEVEAMNQYDLLHDKLVIPTKSWDDTQLHGLDDEPVELLSELLLAALRAKISLRGLHIWTPPPMIISRLLPGDEDDHSILQTASENLKAVWFNPWQSVQGGMRAKRDIEEWPPLIRFLKILVASVNLKHISLSLDFMWEDSVPSVISMDPVLLSHTWPMLESLSFSGSFHFREIQQVVNRLSSEVRLQLSGYLSKFNLNTI